MNIGRKGYKLLSFSGPTDRPKGIMKVTVDFQNFGSQFKMSSTPTEFLRIFSPSCRQRSRYTLMSVNLSNYAHGPLDGTKT
jgi:hypothetical protein